MKTVKMLLLTMMICFAVYGTSTMSFASGSKTCDNDPATSGCSGTKFGTWSHVNTVSSASTHDYSDDHEEQSNSNQSGYSSRYLWGLSTGLSTTTRLSYYAYLYNSTATNHLAEYGTTAGALNDLDQDTAPTGWNYLGAGDDSGVTPLYVYSSAGNGLLVADAAQVTW